RCRTPSRCSRLRACERPRSYRRSTPMILALQRAGQNLLDREARGLIRIAHVHWRTLAPSSERLLVCTVDPLPARKEACSLTFKRRIGSVGRFPSRQVLWSNRNDDQSDAPRGPRWAFNLRGVAAACAGTKQVQRRRGYDDTRAARSL